MSRRQISTEQIGTRVVPVLATDFSRVSPCRRCDGHSDYNGSAAGGVLSFLRRGIDGVWYSYAGACSCLFGALRASRAKKTGFAISYADDLLDIPAGLTQQQWSAIRVCAQTRLTWEEVTASAVKYLPEYSAQDLSRKMEDFCLRRTPQFDPFPRERRTVPDPEESAPAPALTRSRELLVKVAEQMKMGT